MIRLLADPANAITGCGLILSVTGLHFALAGRPALGVAIVLWALLADHLDGVVAARTKGRSPETSKVGKSLDSLADLVSAGVFPAIVLIEISGGSPAAVLTGAALVLASALRLSYFNTVGLADGCFIGVPTTYVLPCVAVLFLIAPILPASSLPLALNAVLLVLAFLHVTPVRVPRTSGVMYIVVTIFCLAASGVLASSSI